MACVVRSSDLVLLAFSPLPSVDHSLSSYLTSLLAGITSLTHRRGRGTARTRIILRRSSNLSAIHILRTFVETNVHRGKTSVLLPLPRASMERDGSASPSQAVLGNMAAMAVPMAQRAAAADRVQWHAGLAHWLALTKSDGDYHARFCDRTGSSADTRGSLTTAMTSRGKCTTQLDPNAPADAETLRRRRILPVVSSERPGARVWRFEDIFGGTEVVASLGPAFER